MPGTRDTGLRPIVRNALLIAYFHDWRGQAISLTLSSRILETAIFSGLVLTNALSPIDVARTEEFYAILTSKTGGSPLWPHMRRQSFRPKDRS